MVKQEHTKDINPLKKSINWIQHPLIKPEKIESRLYQQALAAQVLKKGNTMIVAPTALGKTIVAALVSAERLNRIPSSKILMLAPSKPLAVQHEESLKEFLKAPVNVLTGSITPDKRVKLWEKSRVISATPQTVESDVIAGRYDLKDVSLLIFDECHRGTGNYAYVFLANRYMREGKDPLILGLTASPGGDEEKINTVCQNLFINEVMVKTEDDVDVKPYFKPIEIKWVFVEMGKEQKKIKAHLDKVLKNRLKGLKNFKIITSISNVSRRDILQARGRVQNRISRTANPRRDCLLAMSMITAVINLQHALELLETQGISNLHHYFQKLKKKKTKASRGLFQNEDFNAAVQLTRRAYTKKIEHPKMTRLLKILKKELLKDQQIIVFSQYRDTVNEIHSKCEKEGIKSVKFFGQASREKEKGLTQKEQKQIIKNFRKGLYQVLISTSVAEEGIDIPSVDQVILYEPVPSEIRMIQRRGRTGRKTEGQMTVLITKGTRDESYYWSSLNKEQRMKNQLTRDFPQSNISLDRSQTKISNGGKQEPAPEDEIPPDNLVIYVDHREAKSGVVRELSNLGVKMKFSTLDVADYQISEDIGVERKSAQDFTSSIIDKRLYKQAKDLSEQFSKPVIIIEGKNMYAGGLHPNAVRGSLASLAIDYSIPIIPTRSPEDTAAMIYRLAMRELEKGSMDVPLRTEKKPLSLQEQQIFIIESLPNVGPVTARKLLEKFGSVKGVINAEKDELTQVEGIGKVIAQKILDVIDSDFMSRRAAPDIELKLSDILEEK
ncbi:MAG: DEAD/DEAH box helicase [Methanobacteriaceae archaeon]|nr:DEAD/DEAH box helicase [Methanobacteriaceae archaeon]